MMSMILLVLHAAQATSEARARPEEEKPQSERPARPGAEKVEKEIAIVNRFGLHLRHAARFAQVANRFRGESPWFRAMRRGCGAASPSRRRGCGGQPRPLRNTSLRSA